MNSMKNFCSLPAVFLCLMLLPHPSWCGSSKPHPTPTPLEYTLQDIKGTVLIKEKDESKPEKAEEEETVESGDEIITQAGSKATLTLNQTTLFNLSENSDVKVDQLMRKKSSHGFLSRLALLKGKILCEVEKLKTSRSTFEVSSGGVVCGVRGTSFEVENDNSQVDTNTYNGVVEMKKDDQVQNVEANQHQDFAFDENTFLPKRALTKQERDNYQKWLTLKAVAERKFQERQAVLNSLYNLSQDEQDELLQKLEQIKEKDRLKVMRQLLQDKYKNLRQKTLNKIQEDAARKRQENNQLRRNP